GILRGNHVPLNQGRAAYIVYPIADEDTDDRDAETPVIRGATLEFVLTRGPTTIELPPRSLGLIQFQQEQGISDPLVVLPFFRTVLGTSHAHWPYQLRNPFQQWTPATYPRTIRLSAWSVGWSRADVKDLLGVARACQTALEEWIRRVPLWGNDPT